jgi:hypothetical protein
VTSVALHADQPFHRVPGFSWERTARMTLDVYEAARR